MALGSTQPLVKMSTGNIPGCKGGRHVRLTTSQPSRAECHEIWEPKPPGNLSATLGLLRDSFTFKAEVLTARCCGLNPSGMWRSVAGQVLPDVSNDRTASIFMGQAVQEGWFFIKYLILSCDHSKNPEAHTQHHSFRYQQKALLFIRSLPRNEATKITFPQITLEFSCTRAR